MLNLIFLVILGLKCTQYTDSNESTNFQETTMYIYELNNEKIPFPLTKISPRLYESLLKFIRESNQERIKITDFLIFYELANPNLQANVLNKKYRIKDEEFTLSNILETFKRKIVPMLYEGTRPIIADIDYQTIKELEKHPNIIILYFANFLGYCALNKSTQVLTYKTDLYSRLKEICHMDPLYWIDLSISINDDIKDPLLSIGHGVSIKEYAKKVMAYFIYKLNTEFRTF